MVLQLLKVLNKWTEILDMGGEVDVIYCDFMKAFDTVPHSRLLDVLVYYGINDPVLSWIKAFLSNRKQRVMVNGVPSSWYDVVSGIPQGSVLGPVLFVIFINTLVDVIKDSEAFMFADDTKIFKGIFKPEDCELLQGDIENAKKWSDDSKLRFHPDKMASMRISLKKDVEHHTYHMSGKDLAKSEQETDLGVIIDSKLTFEAHIQGKINKANSIMGVIRRTMDYLDPESFKLLFTSLVRPHLEFANAIWCPYWKKHIVALENVQRRASKRVPGLSILSYPERLRKIGLPTLQYRRYRGDMIETFKITHGIYDTSVTADFLPIVPKNTETRGHDYMLFKRRCHYKIRNESFTYRIVDQWNNLPKCVVHVKTVQTFERNLDKMWSDLKPAVMYNYDGIDFRKETTRYNIRYYKLPRKAVTNQTNPTDINHAQDSVESNTDLRLEGPYA